MADWKYVMFQLDSGTCIPVIFPNILVHDDVAKRLRHVVEQSVHQPAQAVSAGFLTGLIAVGCHGESESMGGVKSRGYADRTIINEMPYAHGRTDGVSCEPMIIEAALRHLRPTEEQVEAVPKQVEAVPKQVEAVPKPVDPHARSLSDSTRFNNGNCRGCNRAKGRGHKAGCTYDVRLVR